MQVVVCGLAPLPGESARQNPATGARTWQFARALSDAGCRVQLALRRIPGAYADEPQRPRSYRVGDLEVTDAPWEMFVDRRWLRRTAREVNPDIVVGACLHGSYDACRMASEQPVWADLFGDPMAEAQAVALRSGSNRPLFRRWRMLRTVLRRADRLSTVSDRQRLATLGELAAVGRLNRETAGEELVRTISFGLEQDPPRSGERVVRGRLVQDDDIVVLWSGSYNVWTDPGTLFEGVDRAMRDEPRLHFVSTGGEVAGYDARTYRQFADLVATSPRRDRFHLLGWISRERAASVLYEADIGVVVERRLHEGELGTKTRIVEWMAAGLPILATDVSELPSYLAAVGAAVTVPPADPAALARAMLQLARDPERLDRTRRAARVFLDEELSFSVTCAPLLAWAQRPVAAADRTGLGREHRPWPRWSGGSFDLPAVPLSLADRMGLVGERLLHWTGLKGWWLRRKLRSARERRK